MSSRHAKNTALSKHLIAEISIIWHLISTTAECMNCTKISKKQSTYTSKLYQAYFEHL